MITRFRQSRWFTLAVGVVGGALAMFVLLALLLAFTGPRIGSVFSNTVNSFAPMQGAAPPMEDGIFDTASRIVPADFQPQEREPVQERIVIRNATLVITVDDPAAKIEAIATLADEMGGWVVNSSTYKTTLSSGQEVTQGSISVRVPAGRLDEALTTIKEGTSDVNSENITGEDVTQQYVDVSSRLKNLEAAEAQLQEILDAARTTEDVLAVYTELVRIRGDIEVAKGQIQYFEQSAAFSSIAVTLYATPSIQPIEVAGWRPLETVRNAFQTLVNVLQGVVDVVIFVVIVGLPLAVIGGAIYLGARRIRRVMRDRRAAASGETEASS